jgi:uncharacterized protein YyaL (SSP411 family)
MGDWEIEVQADDGGIMQGLLRHPPSKSVVFDTGMVMHGWLDLSEHTGGEAYLSAAERAGRFLCTTQSDDGAWRGHHSYRGIPHTHQSRVSWALLRLAEASGEAEFGKAARRNLAWVLSNQRPNGWFDACAFIPGRLPNTHGLAYTVRGLLEAAELTGSTELLEAATRTAHAVVRRREELGSLPATFDEAWQPRANYICVTGLAQFGGVWLRLFQLTGEPSFREAGIGAVEGAAGFQQRDGWKPIRGALPGSFPIYGRYAPLQFPNWATKFLADSLLLRAACLPRPEATGETDRERR